jgi:hypothetical protein
MIERQNPVDFKLWNSSSEIKIRYPHLFPVMDPAFFRPGVFTEGSYQLPVFPTSYHQPPRLLLKRWSKNIDTTWSDKAPLVQIWDKNFNHFQTAICFGAKKHGYAYQVLKTKMSNSDYHPDTTLQADLVVNSEGKQKITFTRVNSWKDAIIMGAQVLATIPPQFRTRNFELYMDGLGLDLVTGKLHVSQRFFDDAVGVKQRVEKLFEVTLPELQVYETKLTIWNKEETISDWKTQPVVVPDLLDKVNFASL